MNPALTSFAGVLLLVLFGWYFATDSGLRKHLLALFLAAMLVVGGVSVIMIGRAFFSQLDLPRRS